MSAPTYLDKAAAEGRTLKEVIMQFFEQWTGDWPLPGEEETEDDPAKFALAA